jgi:Tfp pilus assembly protein PilO
VGKQNPLRYGNWLATSIMAGLTIAYMFLFCLPTMRGMREMREEIRSKEEMMSHAGELAWQYQASQAEQRETEQFVQAWRERAPHPDGVAVVFGKTSELARASRAQITRFEPHPAVEYETMSRVPLDIGCHGSLPELFEFVKALEAMPAPLWVEEVRLSPRGETRQDLQCDLKLAIFADKSELSD